MKAIREIVAQAWCKEKTKNTIMDSDLAEEFAKILDIQLRIERDLLKDYKKGVMGIINKVNSMATWRKLTKHYGEHTSCDTAHGWGEACEIILNKIKSLDKERGESIINKCVQPQNMQNVLDNKSEETA